ncbi:hypothetical protein LI177_02895 [bacterium 210820-DFI.6.37]|nr:hypothetical protein [bacterium 210820-DFI.6.37]
MAKNYEKAYKDRQKGMSYKDIAAKYNVSINTVKSWKTKQWARIEQEAHKNTQKDTHSIGSKQADVIIQEAGAKIDGRGQNAKQDSQNIKALKELVQYKKATTPPAYSFKDTGKMIQRIGEYFQRQDESELPYTRAGLILALGICRDTYNRYLRGDMDYLLEEHITINSIDMDNCDKIKLEDHTEIAIDAAGNPLISFSRILEKAALRLEEQAESRLYKSARPGDIFTMKQYGWTDERSPGTVNNTLVIATAEESDRALKMLYGGK